MLKKKARLKAVSLILVFTLIFTGIPFNNFAASAESPTTEGVEKTEKAQAVYIVKELENLRTEYSKTYLKSDGKLVAVLSADAMHYKSGNAWQEIDNTLTTVKDENGNECFQNTKAGFTAQIPSDLDSNSKVQIESNNYSVKMTLLQTDKKSNGKKIGKKAEKATEKQRAKMSAGQLAGELCLTDGVEYSDVYADTNINYDVVSHGVKESIILEKKPKKNVSYSYSINAEGMIAILNTDNSIDFFAKTDINKESVLFTMPAPFMFDSNDNYSNDIATTLKQNGDNYILTYTPSHDWLKTKKRAYPVTIDPTVFAKGSTSVSDAYVLSGEPNVNTNYGYEQKIRIGYSQWPQGTLNDFISYIKFNQLPVIPTGSVVTSASLNLHHKAYINGSCLYSGVYEVKGAWDEYSITYNNRPQSADTATDYRSHQINDNGYLSWDITSLAKGWINGTSANNGVMIKMLKEYGNAQVLCDFDSQASLDSDTWPYLLVEYTNQNGNNNSSSKSIDVGRAGSISINDYTGNVTLTRKDIGINSNVMPVNISMVYNNNDRNNILINNGTSISAFGAGFRSNYSQTIKYVVPGNPGAMKETGEEYYAYTTGTGKVIYFEKTAKPDGNGNTIYEYKDVSNGGYTLSSDQENPTSYQAVTIKDNSNQWYYFDSLGRLIKIAGNMKATENVTGSSIPSEGTSYEPGVIAITYRSDFPNGTLAINTITDGIGRVYNFIYDSASKMLTGINNNATGADLRTVNYTYLAGGILQSVNYPDGKTVWYGFTGNKELYRAKNCDNYMFQFAYDSHSVVQRIQEFGIDGTAGSDTYVVHEGNETKYIKSVDYQNYLSGNNVPYQSMQFNNYGDLTSSLVAGSDADNAYSVYARYSSKGFNTRATNQLISLSNKQKSVTNLIKNPTFSQGFNSYQYSNATLSTEHVLFGEKSVLIPHGGFVHQSLYVEGGRTYTASAYIYCEDKNSSGAQVCVVANPTNGAQITYLGGSQILEHQNGWERTYWTFKANTSGYVTFGLNPPYGQDKVYFDGLQLEYGDTPGRFNMLSNSEFYLDTDSWTRDTSHTALSNTGFNGGKSISLTGMPNATNTVTQTVAVSGKKGDTYTFGGWAKSAVFANKADSNFAIRLSFLNADGNVIVVGGVNADETVSFNHSISGWQYVMTGATAPADFSSIRIDLKYDHQVNTAYFDGIQLYKEVFASNYYYKSNGMLDYIQDVPSVGALNQGSSTTGLTESDSSYSSDTANISKTGVATQNQYDNYGNLVQSVITDGQFEIATLKAYSTDGGYAVSSTDALGNQTGYNYNSALGTLKSKTDPKGNAVNYSYNAVGKLTGMYQLVANLNNGDRISAAYSYDSGDRLSVITHNNFNYSFQYDNFGVLKSIKSGGQTLVTYNYDQNYLTTGMAYENSQTIQYGYNNSGYLTSIKQAGQAAGYSFSYDNDGNLTMVYDEVNGVRTNFTTDADGNTVATTRSISSGDVTHEYSTNDGTYTEKIGTTTYNMRYSYDDDGRLTWASWDNGDKTSSKEIKYDSLGRVASTNIYTNNDIGTSKLGSVYNYNSGTGSNTSKQVSSIAITSPIENQNKTLTYEYDQNGNIIKANGVSYVYDEAGQLVRINDPAYGTTVYVYDVGGNIKYVKSYAYTTGTVDTATSTKTYGYDSVWKDKLTNYNGQTIYYDTIGNPTTYRDGFSFNWQMGKQLASATKNNKTYSYKYNSDGLRVSKAAIGINEKYSWADGKLTHMSSEGFYDSYFRYDSDGRAISIKIDGNVPQGNGFTGEYFYVYNLQGDVIGLVDSTGSWVVEYTYDAWGKPLKSGSLASTLGEFNPFRYRGYFYDTETGLYYLQSRYYDPETGRFVNAADPSTLLLNGGELSGINLYAYAENNPVNLYAKVLPLKTENDALGGTSARHNLATASDKGILSTITLLMTPTTVWSAVGDYTGMVITGKPQEDTLSQNQSWTLDTMSSPGNFIYKDAIWMSSKPRVATVDENGKLTGLSPGTTTITVWSVTDKTFDSFILTVTEPPYIAPTGVVITNLPENNNTFKLNESWQLNSAVYPANATDQSVNWQSGDENVAVVDGNGYVTPISSGTVTITITSAADELVSTQVTFNVESKVSMVYFAKPPMFSKMIKGQTLELSPGITCQDGVSTALSFESSNINIATVSASGAVTALRDGNGGDVTIKATSLADPTKFAVTTITVLNTDVGVRIGNLPPWAAYSPACVRVIKLGHDWEPSAWVAFGDSSGVSWSTSDSKVASVKCIDGKIMIHPEKIGYVNITATTSNGYTDTAYLYVSNIDSVTIKSTPTSFPLGSRVITGMDSIIVGTEIPIFVEVSYTDGTPTITSSASTLVHWESSNSDAVNVYEADGTSNYQGQWVGRAQGIFDGRKAVLTVYSNDGTQGDSCTVTTSTKYATSVMLDEVPAPPQSPVMYKGDVEQLKASLPLDASDQWITWTSKNPAVAKFVDRLGGECTSVTVLSGERVQLKARAGGNAEIQANSRDGAAHAKFNLTVWVPVSSVVFTGMPQGNEMVKGVTTCKLTAAADGFVEAYEWISSKPSVASMDPHGDGTVTANGDGYTDISYRVYTNNKYKEFFCCRIHVTVPVKSVVVSNTSSKNLTLLSEYDTCTLTATVNPDATDKTVTWSSGDSSVVKFLKSDGSEATTFTGKDATIIAKGAGTTYIEANASGIKKRYTVTVNPFNYTSTTYDNKLATQCAEYAMLAYDTMDSDSNLSRFVDKGDKNRTIEPVQLIYCLTKNDFHLENIVSRNYGDNTDWNVSYVLASKQVSFNGVKRTLVAVIIRGTDGVEWQGDMDVTGDTYVEMDDHYSFKKAKDDLKNNTNTLKGTDGLNYYLTNHGITNPLYLITGHSRGAGVSNLLAEDLNQSAGTSNVFAYTFATPNTTKKPDTSSTNIFNFCFHDDFVPQVPLYKWGGYDKHGITRYYEAGALYNLCSDFRGDMDTYLRDSGLKPASFNLEGTFNLLDYIKQKWPTVDNYYNDKIYLTLDHDVYTTPYWFFRDTVALAAKGDLSAGAALIAKRNTPDIFKDVFKPIATFFVDGSGKFMFDAYIYDAHCAFTYYTAVKYGYL